MSPGRAARRRQLSQVFWIAASLSRWSKRTTKMQHRTLALEKGRVMELAAVRDQIVRL